MFTGSSAKVCVCDLRWGCDKCVLGSVPVFEDDSPIDLDIASVLEGAQVCTLGAKHYWQEALIRAF